MTSEHLANVAAHDHLGRNVNVEAAHLMGIRTNRVIALTFFGKAAFEKVLQVGSSPSRLCQL